MMTLDESQITHLICVRLKHLPYDFLGGGGGLGLLPVVFLYTVPVQIHTELIPKEAKSEAVILINTRNLGNCNCNF